MNAEYKTTRRITAGNVHIGGGAPISVQSMTNTDSHDVESTLAQINRLAAAGCDIVRVSVYDDACADAMRAYVDKSPVPLVADIHYDHRLAIRSVECGVAKLRINPGNIGGEANVARLADCAKAHSIPIRIGVNSGSIEKELLSKHGGPTARCMVESALNHARMLERCGYYDTVLSLKASDVRTTVEAYRMASQACDYPLHLGVTEAGTPGMGNIKSAIGIGALLIDGIGDTIRVSLTGDPEPEAAAAIDILNSIGLRPCVDIVSCPTCGRTCIDVLDIADRVKNATRHIHMQLKIAVMGCVVNGIGEGREADIGIAGAKDGGALFIRGQSPTPVRGDLAQTLIRAVESYVRDKENA